MSWWHDFADEVKQDVPLAPLTWFRLGGAADFLARPRDADRLEAMVYRAREEGLEVRVLGDGANVLVADDGVDGLVIRLDQPAFRRVVWEETRARVGAGVDLMPFTRLCSSNGLSGLEAMAGIPGTVGGAVRMNAGGRDGEFGDVVREIAVLTSDGKQQVLPRDRLRFGYRSSAIRNEIILSAQVELRREDAAQTRSRYEEFFAAKKVTQPIADHSAGCIFRNPPGEFAGRLVDRAGLKGHRFGGAYVSHRHANFIVADRGGRADDVLRLIDEVRERVLLESGVELETEVEIWKRGPGVKARNGERRTAACP